MALFAECRYADLPYAECRYAECRYAKCRYATCRGAAPYREKLYSSFFLNNFHFRMLN
jgi:hypothetical protein